MNKTLHKAKDITKSVIKYLMILVLAVLWAIFMSACFIVGALVIVPLISIIYMASDKGLPDVSLKAAIDVYDSILKEMF
jgi:hypothetical protein